MAHLSFSLQAQGCRGCVDAPVSVEEGIEAKAIAPAAGEVGDVHIGVADRLALAPHQQGFLSRQPRRTGPELLLAEQAMWSMCWVGGRYQRLQAAARERL